MQILFFRLGTHPPAKACCSCRWIKTTEVEQYGTGSWEAENALDDGTYYEKTILQFSTAEEITNTTPLAFVIMDAQENYYLIGAREAPYPIIEIAKSVSTESNVNNIKVTFTRRKSLIPCSI